MATKQHKAMCLGVSLKWSTTHCRAIAHAVNFTTSKTDRYETNSTKSHVNLAILDSNWEGEFCRVIEAHPRTLAYVKNHGLGFDERAVGDL